MRKTLTELAGIRDNAPCPTCRELAAELYTVRENAIKRGSARTPAKREAAIKRDNTPMGRKAIPEHEIPCTCNRGTDKPWREHHASCRRYTTMYQRERRNSRK